VSQQISNHLASQAAQHAKEQQAAKPAHEVYAAHAAESHRAAQATQTPKEAYEAKVAIENYRQQNREKVVTVPLDQASQSPLTVHSAQENLARAQQNLQAAYQAQVVQAQQAQKHLAPDRQALWNYISEEHRGVITRNYAIVVKNHTIVENNIRLHEQHQAACARLLQLIKEDAGANIAVGTIFTGSDVAKATRFLEVGEKIHAFFVQRFREIDPSQDKANIAANIVRWEYVVKARQKLKVEVERYVACEEDRVAHEGPAIKAIQSFATAEKQLVLLNKPAAQKEFDFFYSSMNWFPGADFATITKLNLSNSGMLDNNAYSLANTLAALPNLKYLDVSGNQITPTGEGYLVKALQSSMVKDITITIKKYSTELGQKVIKPALKEFIVYAGKQGIDTTHIATNKNAFVYMNDIINIKSNFLIGFTKCETGYSYLENGVTVEDLATEAALTHRAMKYIAPLVCIYEALDGAFTTPEGVDLVIKGLELLGDNE
jgi:hypothetical protein